MEKIILQGYIIVSDIDLPIIKNELLIHEKLTRQESGCLIFQVSQDHINPNQFNVYEEFTDQEAFDDHQLRVKNSNWGKVTTNIERHYQITKI